MAGSYYSTDADDLDLSEERLIELTDNVDAPGVVDQTVVDRAARDAQSRIDGKLSGTYVVPFSQGAVPDPVRLMHVALKRYYIFRHRDALNIPASVVDEYKQAQSDLDDYATPDDGGMFLLGANRISGAGTSTGTSASPGYFSSDPCDGNPIERVFGRARDRLG